MPEPGDRRPRTVTVGPFTTTLVRHGGKGGWTFAITPKRLAPPATRPWGRTPVQARLDNDEWKTSLWRDSKSDRSLLAVPARLRRGKGDGDRVRITFTWEPETD
jgi:hypothetical protein